MCVYVLLDVVGSVGCRININILCEHCVCVCVVCVLCVVF